MTVAKLPVVDLSFLLTAPLASYAAAGSAVTVSKKGYDGPATYTPQYNYYDWSQSAFTYK